MRISTGNSPIGPVPRGQIVVVDDDTHEVFTGVYATRASVCRCPPTCRTG